MMNLTEMPQPVATSAQSNHIQQMLLRIPEMVVVVLGWFSAVQARQSVNRRKPTHFHCIPHGVSGCLCNRAGRWPSGHFLGVCVVSALHAPGIQAISPGNVFDKFAVGLPLFALPATLQTLVDVFHVIIKRHSTATGCDFHNTNSRTHENPPYRMVYKYNIPLNRLQGLVT